jgi:chemotaxis protein methyltransferase CheR
VFIRNVLIYFEQAAKVEILERVAKQMAPDGFMVLGAAETVVGLTDAFRAVPGSRGLYQPNPRLCCRFFGATFPVRRTA